MELTVHTTSGFFFYSNIKAFLAADSNLITLTEIKLTFPPSSVKIVRREIPLLAVFCVPGH